MNQKFQEFKVCLHILNTEPTIDSKIIKNCFQQLKERTKTQPTTEDFLYICLCILSVSTDDTVKLDSFKCIFENESISYTRLLITLDYINSAIYRSY
jgi:hypothetical protein